MKSCGCIKGETDNIVFFKAGYNCNPTAMELHVSHHPEVRSVLMLGTGGYQPALLVEPHGTRKLFMDLRKSLVERIWLTCRAKSKSWIFVKNQHFRKTHIHVLDPDHPMRYAGKGTVQPIYLLHSSHNLRKKA